MTKPGIDLSQLKSGGTSKTLADEANWKSFVAPSGAGYFTLQTNDTGDVPVRMFLTECIACQCGRQSIPANSQRHTIPRREAGRDHTRRSLRLWRTSGLRDPDRR